MMFGKYASVFLNFFRRNLIFFQDAKYVFSTVLCHFIRTLLLAFPFALFCDLSRQNFRCKKNRKINYFTTPHVFVVEYYTQTTSMEGIYERNKISVRCTVL